MEEKLKIFFCEDDENLGMLLREYLQAKGYVTDLFSDGEAGYKGFTKGKYDLCVLDVMMPKKDGFTLAQEIRSINPDIPVIFLTAKTMKEDILEGFKIGADDYLVKPFAMDLLTAKVQAVLRRVNAVQEKSLEKFGCELNLLTNDLDFQGESVRLTPTEGLIMKLLMLNANQTVSKKKLISALWQGNNFIDENALNVNLSRLRGKLSTLEGPLQITTVRGQGYRLEEKL